MPLAIPMLAGPGAMTATMSLVAQHSFVVVALAVVRGPCGIVLAYEGTFSPRVVLAFRTDGDLPGLTRNSCACARSTRRPCAF